MENKYITVTALNRYIQYKFDQDIHLQTVYIKAEISNLRLSKGILYFVLKDEESELEGLMFQQAFQRLKFNPVDGMTVLVSGRISIYLKKGRYAITAVTMEEAGLGDAYLKFLQLKEKLQNEGLFDPQYKKPIPKFCEKIGVITSGTGDAFHDIVSTITKRYPLAKIYLYSALVQGQEAPKSLIKALRQSNIDKLVDVVIIARGGGSIEDLSCFNDEELAREIFKSDIPTVSGVGHEADFTICDFVASLRAPTPTGAAVLVTPEKEKLYIDLMNIQKQIANLTKQKIINGFNEYQNLINSYGFKNFLQILKTREDEVNYLTNHLQLVSPLKIIENYEENVNGLKLRLSLINLDQKIVNFYDKVVELESLNVKNTNKLLDLHTENINQQIDKLILLNPLNLMKKGYTVTYQQDKIVSTVKDVNPKEDLIVRFADGKVVTKVVEVKDEIISQRTSN